MKNLKDEIEGILQPMFQYEVQICTKCQHSFGGHYWGTELDSCRHEGCKCVAEHGGYRTEVRNDSVPESYVVELTSLIEQEKERVRKETREQAVREFVKVCHKNEIYGDTGIVTGNFIDSGNSDLECLAEQYLAERKG